jgi:hypothetical protein
MEVPKPNRRPWLTHELAVLLMIALVAILGLGWLGIEASTVRYRRAMIEKIEAAGGGSTEPTSAYRLRSPVQL